MREAPSVGQYIKQYDKQSGKHCGNKYVATTLPRLTKKKYINIYIYIYIDNNINEHKCCQ